MPDGVSLNLNGRVIHCDVARTHAEHTLGLQRYASLAPDEGLLFAFDKPAFRTFHMAEVRFPIDILFLRDGKVVRVAESVSPGDQELYSARCDVVLEVRAGVAREASVRLGDKVDIAVDDRSSDSHKRADGANEWSEQDREIHEREQDHPDEQHRDKMMPDDIVTSSPGMYDQPKEEYFRELWPEAIANEALDVRPALQTRLGSRKTAGRNIVVSIPKGRMGEIAREEADVARREKDGETLNYFWQMGRLPKEQPERIFFAWDGAVRAYHDVTGMDRAGGRIYMGTAIHGLPHPVEMEPFRGFRYFDWPGNRPVESKRAQIVDDQKFVDKTAPILFAHADLIPWKKDALNGGATERAVVSRSDLASWLSGNQESGQGAAEPGSVQYILQAAGDDRGMKLIGTAFVMAELADFTRIGFSGRQPTLVLYRETPSVEESEQTASTPGAYTSPSGS